MSSPKPQKKLVQTHKKI